MRRLLAGVLTTVVLLGFGPAFPAAAVDPIAVTEQITDPVGVLTPTDKIAVQKSFDQFFERTGNRIVVAYVTSFGDRTPDEWATETAKRSGLGKNTVLLVFATKDRAFGHATANPRLTPDELNLVDREHIAPALHDDNYAKATIEAADAYGDVAVARQLPWQWIVPGISAALVLAWLWVLRSRRRFEHTHHVVDEHGKPVDPANILTLDEIDRTSSTALHAVDDALLTSATDVARATAQLGTDATLPFVAVLEQSRAELDRAFRARYKLDKLIAKERDDEEAERKWRKRASRILTICEQVDADLDSHVEAFDRARDLRHADADTFELLQAEHNAATVKLIQARQATTALTSEAVSWVDGNLKLAEGLLAAASQYLKNDHDAPILRLRITEDALSTVHDLLDAVADAAGADDVASQVDLVGRFVATRRGAVGTRARTLRTAAQRLLHDEASHDRAGALAAEALDAATTDVAASKLTDPLALAGILVERTSSGGLKSILGGATHGGGSGTPFRGSEHGDDSRTVGRFGGTTTRGRRTGFSTNR